MRHTRLVWALFLLLAGLSWWLAEREPPPALRNEVREGPREVDYYLRRLEATDMGPQGRPARTLTVEELRHYPDDDTTALDAPRLAIYREPGSPPWRVQAERGWVSPDGELVLLQGAVRIDRAAAPGVRPLHIETRDLRVQPRQDYAETDEAVRVRSRRDRLQATGMQAWLRHPARIKLPADVKGYYAPPLSDHRPAARP